MTNAEIITAFYTALQQKDAPGMTRWYGDDVVFRDPAFGQLQGIRAKAMWHMLLDGEGTDLQVSFSNVTETEDGGTARIIAEYVYGPKKRKVRNRISATFTIREGVIIRHVDHFNLWRWSRQALGLPGWVLGWTPWMRKKVQQTSNRFLSKYIKKKGLDPSATR